MSSVEYGDDGRVWQTTDPRGIINQTEYDRLGRATRTIENYVDGVQGDAEDKIVVYTHGPAGMTSLTALSATGAAQTTEWVFGVTAAGGSGLTSNDIVGVTQWPDPSTGSATGSEQETVTVNALGQPVTSTDRNGTEHTLDYDILGRVVDSSYNKSWATPGRSYVQRYQPLEHGAPMRPPDPTITPARVHDIAATALRDTLGIVPARGLTADWIIGLVLRMAATACPLFALTRVGFIVSHEYARQAVHANLPTTKVLADRLADALLAVAAFTARDRHRSWTVAIDTRSAMSFR